MSTLTHEDMQVLKGFFPANEHEFDYNKNAYIKEQSICNRIEEVDPAWQLSEPKIHWRDGLGGTAICEVTVVITIKGTSRGGLGQKEIVATKKGDSEANQAAKSAATDALKRAARLFGIGRYLLDLPSNVNNEQSLNAWLRAQSHSSNITELQQPEQSGTLKEFVTDEIIMVGIKQKGENRYIIADGCTFFSRNVFRALEYSEEVIDSLGIVGMQKLPDPIRIVYTEKVGNDNNTYKEPLRVKRMSTGEVIDLNELKEAV